MPPGPFVVHIIEAGPECLALENGHHLGYNCGAMLFEFMLLVRIYLISGSLLAACGQQ